MMNGVVAMSALIAVVKETTIAIGGVIGGAVLEMIVGAAGFVITDMISSAITGAIERKQLNNALEICEQHKKLYQNFQKGNRSMIKLKKRIMSLLLCGAMVFSLCPQTASAVSIQRTAADSSSLCEHHTEHNGDCGYSEGSEGTPCTHQHSEDCYTEITECVHEHDEGCYLETEDSVSDNTATPSNAEEREPEHCNHVCSEENGCIMEKLDCQHEHDSEVRLFSRCGGYTLRLCLRDMQSGRQ